MKKPRTGKTTIDVVKLMDEIKAKIESDEKKSYTREDILELVNIDPHDPIDKRSVRGDLWRALHTETEAGDQIEFVNLNSYLGRGQSVKHKILRKVRKLFWPFARIFFNTGYIFTVLKTQEDPASFNIPGQNEQDIEMPRANEPVTEKIAPYSEETSQDTPESSPFNVPTSLTYDSSSLEVDLLEKQQRSVMEDADIEKPSIPVPKPMEIPTVTPTPDTTNIVESTEDRDATDSSMVHLPKPGMPFIASFTTPNFYRAGITKRKDYSFIVAELAKFGSSIGITPSAESIQTKEKLQEDVKELITEQRKKVILEELVHPGKIQKEDIGLSNIPNIPSEPLADIDEQIPRDLATPENTSAGGEVPGLDQLNNNSGVDISIPIEPSMGPSLEQPVSQPPESPVIPQQLSKVAEPTPSQSPQQAQYVPLPKPPPSVNMDNPQGIPPKKESNQVDEKIDEPQIDDDENEFGSSNFSLDL